MWETRCYKQGIPDDAPKEIFDMVPSYKMIVKAILRNDIELLGYIKPVSKYYSILKRIEIQARPTTKVIQLQLPFDTRNAGGAA